MGAFGYAKSKEKTTYVSANNPGFNRSEQKALRNGFEVINDENAYNGRYFVKEGKKWIHNIDALKGQLNINNDYQLTRMGYDVDAYYACR